jgi:predicted nucleic acid-binding protein
MLYLDASALVKRYIEEEGSDELLLTMDSASAWSSCRICLVETVRAVGLAGGSRSIKRVERDWLTFGVVEVDRELAEQAAHLAVPTKLRALDALHLAAALALPRQDLSFATWDIRLHKAARDQGLRTFPTVLD